MALICSVRVLGRPLCNHYNAETILHTSQSGMSLAGQRTTHIPASRHGQPRSRPFRPAFGFCRANVSGDNAPSTSSSSGGQALEVAPAPVPAAAPLASKRTAVLRATKSASRPVTERQKPLAAYMTLPASQYSVLDAQRIERLDADTFRCYVGGLHFLNFHVEPVLTLSVVVGPHGPTVRLLETELQGSKAIVEANKKFSATMTNVVRWQEGEGTGNGSGGLEIASDTDIQVTLEVPPWFVLPVRVIEKSGCAVMQRVLNTAVPRFLQQLEADYEAWAAGDDSRKPVGDGELL